MAALLPRSGIPFRPIRKLLPLVIAAKKGEGIFRECNFAQRACCKRTGLFLHDGKRIVRADKNVIASDSTGQMRQGGGVVENCVVPELADSLRRRSLHLAFKA